jgi:4-alpha-glucanotransferase
MDKYSRMNTPGVEQGNWTFRLLKEDLSSELADHLAIMVDEAKRYGN